jgi:hypothetical protein
MSRNRMVRASIGKVMRVHRAHPSSRAVQSLIAAALCSQGLSLTWVLAEERTVRRMKARPAASHSSYDVGTQPQV